MLKSWSVKNTEGQCRQSYLFRGSRKRGKKEQTTQYKSTTNRRRFCRLVIVVQYFKTTFPSSKNFELGYNQVCHIVNFLIGL